MLSKILFTSYTDSLYKIQLEFLHSGFLSLKKAKSKQNQSCAAQKISLNQKIKQASIRCILLSTVYCIWLVLSPMSTLWFLLFLLIREFSYGQFLLFLVLGEQCHLAYSMCYFQVLLIAGNDCQSWIFLAALIEVMSASLLTILLHFIVQLLFMTVNQNEKSQIIIKIINSLFTTL